MVDLRTRLNAIFAARRAAVGAPLAQRTLPPKIVKKAKRDLVSRRMAAGALLAAGIGSIFASRPVEAADPNGFYLAANIEVDPSAFPFGADTTGTRDATSAINAALASRPGARVRIRSSCNYLVLGTINQPHGSVLVGDGNARASDQTLASVSDFATLPKLILGPSGTIQQADGAGARNLVVIYQAVRALLPSSRSPAYCAAVAAAFSSTTAFVAAGSDTYLDHVQILGFGQAANSTGYGRTLYSKVSFDCTNGLLISGGYDRGWMLDCEGWPFLNADGVSGTSSALASLNRNGAAFKFAGACDWATSIDCFSFGYSRGHVVDGASNIKILRPSHDNTGPVGSVVVGGVTYATGNPNSPVAVSYINAAWYGSVDDLFTTNHLHGVVNASTRTNGSGGWLQINGGNLECGGDCILNNGAAGIYVGGGCFMQGGGYGVNVAAGSDGCTIIGNYLSALANGPFFFDPSVLNDGFGKIVKWGNFCDGLTDAYPDIAQNNVVVGAPGTQGIVVAQDRRPSAPGNGGQLAVGNAANGGDALLGRQWTMRGSLVNGTAGSEASDFIFATYRSGAFVDTLKLSSAGVLTPIVSAPDIGVYNNPFGRVYAALFAASTIASIPAATGLSGVAFIQADASGNLYLSLATHVYKLTGTLVV